MLSRQLPPRTTLITLTAMFGTTVISTAVLMSISKATSGVEIRGKPKPIAPCVMAPTMTIGAPPQFTQSIEGLPALEQAYGFVPLSVKALAVGDQYAALDRGVVEAVDVNTTDGVKLIFDDQTWLLFRLSGTEPVARVYAEACSPKDLKNILDAGKKFVAS